MDTKKLKGLENDIKLKRKFYSKGIWKNYAFVPPALIVFIGVFGLLYLYNNDLLISLYSIPFVLILLLGAIWIKSTKKYLIDQKTSESNSFVICNAVPLTTNNQNELIIFTPGINRHNKNYIEKRKLEFEQKYNNIDSSDIKELTSLDNDDIIILPLSYLNKRSIFTKRNKEIKKSFFIIYNGLTATKLLNFQKIK